MSRVRNTAASSPKGADQLRFMPLSFAVLHHGQSRTVIQTERRILAMEKRKRDPVESFRIHHHVQASYVCLSHLSSTILTIM